MDQDIEKLPKRVRWGPYGGPAEVYDCPEQPDYAVKAGTVVVWAKAFAGGYGKIQIKPWYYRTAVT